MRPMGDVRLPCAPSNFLAGRPAGIRPEAIVLHRNGRTAEQIRARFCNATSAVSAHYVVSKAGAVLPCVAEQDTAFHAGVVVNPTWKCLKPKVNPNFYTIGIELEGSVGDPMPDQQSDACAALVAEIAARRNIPIDQDHIITHNEIRASTNSADTALSRDELIQRALLAGASATAVAAPSEIEILKNTDLREGLPSLAVRIVKVLSAGTKVKVNGFTLQGEAVNGNSAWFQNEEGNFFSAVNSSVPEPRPHSDDEDATAVAPRSAQAPDGGPATRQPLSAGVTCPTGISEIDQFFTADSSAPLDLAKATRDTLGAIQDLLTGHGFSNLPSVLSPHYGFCNDTTQKALSTFQSSCGLPSDALITSQTMKQLVGLAAMDPRATQAHLSLVLGIPFTGIHRLLVLTAQLEGVGRFAALNLNTDLAGLSFGLIQWAQRPGRLLEIVSAFRDADGSAFVQIFGDGNAALASGLIAHLSKPFGGVLEKTGVSNDPQFDLISTPWPNRFKAAALHRDFQRVQVTTARHAFETSLAHLMRYDTAKLVRSERAVAFMLDVANQFGDGCIQKPANAPDRGLAGIYRSVVRSGMNEQDLLQDVGNATAAAMPARFQAAVRARRSLFLTTPILSESKTFESGSAVAGQ